ncbi:MAG: hypothetical protein HC895_01790 [Leptolyngbyaceae cyanobacterium SM1_3_5]|nr:hypothetical protein [Leptolyngbyaceae cyanobacterium SM1_3_5]
MIDSKLSTWILLSSSAIALLLPSPAHSSTPAPLPITVAQASGLEFSDVGRPRRRQGGGSRGSCLIVDRPH